MYVAIVRDAQQVQTYHGKNEIYPTSEDQNLDRNKSKHTWRAYSQENWETIMSDDRTGQEAEVVANVKKKPQQKKKTKKHKRHWQNYFLWTISYDGWRPWVLREIKTHIYYR